MTQVGITTGPATGHLHTQFAQLFGKSWDTGNVTVSYTRTDGNNMAAEERDYYTQDFRPWGLQDSRPRGSSIPGTIHVGNADDRQLAGPGQPDAGTCSTPNAPEREYCGSSSTTLAALLLDPEGTERRQVLPGPTSSATPAAIPSFRTSSTTGTTPTRDLRSSGTSFTGRWISGSRPICSASSGPVSFFAEGFYSDQSGKQTYPAGNGQARMILQTNLQVPTFNPYYPVGGPNNLRVDYSFALEVPTYITGGERAHRIAGGFNFDQLPFDWVGKLTYSWTDDQNYGHANNTINTNAVRAALGNTIAASSDGLYSSYTKPDAVPYLNVLCDPNVFTCNDPATLRYITGYRLQDEQFKIQEIGANFSGPIFQLPGGPLEGAIAFQHLSYDWWYRNLQNDNTHGTHVVTNLLDEAHADELRVLRSAQHSRRQPGNGHPLRRAVPDRARLSLRPLRQSRRSGFCAEGRRQLDRGIRLHLARRVGRVVPRTVICGECALGITRCRSERTGRAGQPDRRCRTSRCANDGTGVGPGTAIPGSLTALLNPTCNDPGNEALFAPGGISVELSGNGAAAVLRGHGLSPQELQQWSVGFNFAPTEGFLAGLNADVSWFRLEFKGLIDNVALDPGSPDDPLFRAQYTVIPRPDLPITAPENADFYQLVQDIIAVPNRGGFGFDPAYIDNIKFIQDTALTNLGSRVFSGLDFTIRYDYDLGEWGSVNVGASGYYQIIDKSRALADGGLDNRYEGKDSGNRLQRVRYRAGWANPTWNVTLFANYFGHGATGSTVENQGVNQSGNALIPPCFYRTGFGPGSCYPGSPYYGPFDTYPNMAPAAVWFDLSIGYQTGEMPANEWLRNVGVQFTVLDLFDEAPPFQVGARGNGSIRAFNEGYSDLQRTFTLQLTKTW